MNQHGSAATHNDHEPTGNAIARALGTYRDERRQYGEYRDWDYGRLFDQIAERIADVLADEPGFDRECFLAAAGKGL